MSTETTIPTFGPLTYEQFNAPPAGTTSTEELWPAESKVTLGQNGRKAIQFGRNAKNGESIEEDGLVYVYHKKPNGKGGHDHFVTMYKAKTKNPPVDPPSPKNLIPPIAHDKRPKSTWFDSRLKSEAPVTQESRNRKLVSLSEAHQIVNDRYRTATGQRIIPGVVSNLAEFLVDECLLAPDTTEDVRALHVRDELDKYAVKSHCVIRPDAPDDSLELYERVRGPMTSNSLQGTTLADSIFNPTDDLLPTGVLTEAGKVYKRSVRLKEYEDAATRLGRTDLGKKMDDYDPLAFASAALELSFEKGAPVSLVSDIIKRAKEAMKTGVLVDQMDATHSSAAAWLDHGFSPGFFGNMLGGEEGKRRTYREGRMAALTTAIKFIIERYRKTGAGKASEPAFDARSVFALAKQFVDLSADEKGKDIDQAARKVMSQIDEQAGRLATFEPIAKDETTEKAEVDVYMKIKVQVGRSEAITLPRGALAKTLGGWVSNDVGSDGTIRPKDVQEEVRSVRVERYAQKLYQFLVVNKFGSNADFSFERLAEAAVIHAERELQVEKKVS